MNTSIIFLSVIVMTTFSFIQSCSTIRYSTGDLRMEKIKNSKQYKNEKFVNYKPSPEWELSDILPTAWDFLVTGNSRTPDVDLPVKMVDFEQIANDSY